MLKNKSCFTIAVILLITILVVGCGIKEAHQPINPVNEAGSPEYSNGTLTFDGIERDYLIHLPDEYSEGTSLPLVVFLHSYGWNAEKALLHTGFKKVADDNGFVIVYPNAIPNWNSGIGENSDYPTPDIDDVGFIRALITEMHDLYHIDLDRVYTTGFSNGGFMAYRLACEASQEIAAIASVGGLMSNSVYENCEPASAIPVMEIHGTNDKYVPYNGMQSWKSVYEIIDYWAKANACESTEIEDLADIDPEDDSTIVKVSHTDCDGNNTVILMRINNGTHTWPGEDSSTYGQVNRDINASEEIWEFFSQY